MLACFVFLWPFQKGLKQVCSLSPVLLLCVNHLSVGPGIRKACFPVFRALGRWCKRLEGWAAFCTQQSLGLVTFLSWDSCHFSAAAVAPKKKIQTTLTSLVVKGTDSIIQEAQQKLGTLVSSSCTFFLQCKNSVVVSEDDYNSHSK